MGSFIDLSGSRFGRLSVIRRDDSESRKWICLCDCGASISTLGSSLRSGNTSSCGCIRLERLRKKLVKHGAAGTPEHRSWTAMMQRCENPEHHKFHLYGAKGVTVCDRWKEFHNFYADMGKRPSLKHTLDRIEGNAGYEPGNCRWATATVQNNNRDSVRTVEFDGQSLTVRDLIDRFGSAVDHRTLSKRIARGWDIKKALETPAVEAKGRIVSDDARERMRQSALKRKDRTRGYQQSEETKQKIRESLTGRKASDETRRKLSEVHKGRIHSDEAKEKIRQAALARPKRTLSEETKTRIKEGMLKHRAAERNAK